MAGVHHEVRYGGWRNRGFRRRHLPNGGVFEAGATGWLVLYWFFASCMAEYTKQGDMLLVVWLKLGLSVSWGPRGCLARGCCCAHSFMLSAVLGET